MNEIDFLRYLFFKKNNKFRDIEEVIAIFCLLSSNKSTTETAKGTGDRHKKAKEYFDNNLSRKYSKQVCNKLKSGHVGSPIIKIINTILSSELKKSKNINWNLPSYCENNKIVKSSKIDHRKVKKYLLAWNIISEKDFEELNKKVKKTAKLSSNQEKMFAIIEKTVRISWNANKNTYSKENEWFIKKEVIERICKAFDCACKKAKIDANTDILSITKEPFFENIFGKYKKKGYDVEIAYNGKYEDILKIKKPNNTGTKQSESTENSKKRINSPGNKAEPIQETNSVSHQRTAGFASAKTRTTKNNQNETQQNKSAEVDESVKEFENRINQLNKEKDLIEEIKNLKDDDENKKGKMITILKQMKHSNVKIAAYSKDHNTILEKLHPAVSINVRFSSPKERFNTAIGKNAGFNYDDIFDKANSNFGHRSNDKLAQNSDKPKSGGFFTQRNQPAKKQN